MNPYKQSSLESLVLYFIQRKTRNQRSSLWNNVSGIGIEKAEKIAYKSLHQLFPTAGYSSARTAAIYSAKYLYGKFSSEVKSTIDAWDAVGVPAETTSRGGQGMVKPQHYITFVKLSNLEKSSGNDCGYKDNSYLHPTIYLGASYKRRFAKQST
ncbi:peptidase M4 family protein [Leptospira noguchii]|nr:M4 family metallopeptidase [Leptospira noguchii]UOG37664.1 peptidase M4 family protein [Leptospira noguchii]